LSRVDPPPTGSGDEGSPGEPDRALLLDLFQTIALTRATEERLERMGRDGLVRGPVRRSLGQEGGVVAAVSTLRRDHGGGGDALAPPARGVGALLSFGSSPLDCFRRHLGRGPLPPFVRRKKDRVDGGRKGARPPGPRGGIVEAVGSPGITVQVMAGITLAFRVRGETRVGMVITGDGAGSTGGWHEGLNLAAVQRCPMVLVVEANGWAFSTPTRGQTRNRSFVERCAAYGIRGASVDGMDPVAVRRAAAAAVARARSGEGVQMLELRTYRLAGHDQWDDQAYVDVEELERWRERDPLKGLARTLLNRGWTSGPDLDERYRRVVEEVEKAAEQALAEPDPAPDQLLERAAWISGSPGPWWRAPAGAGGPGFVPAAPSPVPS
jgi:TPP-dependent pyruvate/acetoin dehydrogenase alpha subunit